MPRATPYDRQTSFALYSAENPLVPHSGVSIDAEFNAVKLSMDETQQNLRLIQDDDGVLKRGSVGRAQFDSSISIGFAAPSNWQPGTTYDAETSTVFYASKFYIAITTHTSGVTFTPGNWQIIADFTVASIIDDGSITSVKLADGAVGANKIADGSISNSKLASGAVSTSKLADAAVTFAKLSTDIGAPIANLVFPAGLGPLPYSGANLPDGWDWADGGVLLSGTVFPTLRARYVTDGFPYGQDGSGNPYKPDARDRATIGKGNMGGSAANRITIAGAGVDTTLLGATGGAQTVTLLAAQLPTINSSGTNAISVTSTVGDIVRSIFGFTSLNATTGGALGGFASSGGNQTGSITSTANNSISVASSNTGGGAHNNVQPILVCNMIVKAH